MMATTTNGEMVWFTKELGVVLRTSWSIAASPRYPLPPFLEDNILLKTAYGEGGRSPRETPFSQVSFQF